MNYYIFLTDEGYTFQPESKEDLLEINNLQVLGFTMGADADEAYKNLIVENPYLPETTFEKIFCYKFMVIPRSVDRR